MGSHRKQRGRGLPPLLARHKISVGKQTTSITISTRHERQAWWSRHNVDPPLGSSDACVAFFEMSKTVTEFRSQSEGTRLSRVKSTSVNLKFECYYSYNRIIIIFLFFFILSLSNSRNSSIRIRHTRPPMNMIIIYTNFRHYSKSRTEE